MTYWDQKLLRQQLDAKLVRLTTASALLPWPGSWIKLIRQALGMTTAQLAHRVGVDQSRISRVEQQESRGDLKLSTLHKIAEAMDMKLVYGFVPNGSLEELVTQQATKIARERLQRLNHTMGLEQQALTDDEARNALQDMIQKILVEQPKDFWDQ